LEQLPDLSSETELEELFSNFGSVKEITMIHNDQGSFTGKAYVNFDNRSKIKMRMALSLNDKWVGQYKLMKVSIPKARF
jgi:RNA recognition motif-containing protein